MSQLSEEKIRSRAYEIYLQRGCRHGHDRDDWLQAEYELMRLPIRKIAEMPMAKSRPDGASRSSVVTLVHTALFLGADALSLIHNTVGIQCQG